MTRRTLAPVLATALVAACGAASISQWKAPNTSRTTMNCATRPLVRVSSASRTMRTRGRATPDVFSTAEPIGMRRPPTATDTTATAAVRNRTVTQVMISTVIAAMMPRGTLRSGLAVSSAASGTPSTARKNQMANGMAAQMPR